MHQCEALEICKLARDRQMYENGLKMEVGSDVGGWMELDHVHVR